MGQQQLLLIVLGVIVVGIAVVVGMDMFSTSAALANRDAVISDLTHIITVARTHYCRPCVLAGGGNSFANFNIPTALLQNANGTFEHTNANHNNDHIHFEGIGTELGEDGTDPIRIEFRMTINELIVTEHN
jgi:hypothetical protein